jgi:hypothetical protein
MKLLLRSKVLLSPQSHKIIFIYHIYKRKSIFQQNMNIPEEKVQILEAISKKVQFLDSSTLVMLPNLTRKCTGAGWYSKDEMESFKSLFVLSITEVRIKFSRGDINDLVTAKMLGMENRLTHDVSEERMHAILSTVVQPLTPDSRPLHILLSQLSREYTTHWKKLMTSVIEEQKWQVSRYTSSKHMYHTSTNWHSLVIFIFAMISFLHISQFQVISLHGHSNPLEQRH